jgi:phosphoglycerate dehydrogenase-like enzyme
VLRPLSAADLHRATRARLVQKFGAGVNTIDVDAATKRGIAAVANCRRLRDGLQLAHLVNQPTGC